MTEVPAEIGVIAPVDASIAATSGLVLDHEPASPSEVNVVELFEQTVSVPLSVPAEGAAVAVPEAATVWSTAEVAEQVILPLSEPEALELNLT